MIHRISELLRIKGMRWADLARKIDTNQSNLMASLRGNPKLSRLQEIADALDVGVTDLFPDAGPSNSAGILTLDKKTYALVPIAEPEKPYFQYDENQLYVHIAQFLMECMQQKTPRPLATCGVYDDSHPFSLFYDGQSGTLYFSIERDYLDVVTWQYDKSKAGLSKWSRPTMEDIAREADRIANSIMDDIRVALADDEEKDDNQ